MIKFYYRKFSNGFDVNHRKVTTCKCTIFATIVAICEHNYEHTRAYLRGGFRGFKPPPKFSDFFLKSEGKEIERKRKKRDVGGGGLPLNIFLG